MKKLTSRQVLKSLGKNLDHLTSEIVNLKITLSPLSIRQLSERVSNCEVAITRMANCLDRIDVMLLKGFTLDAVRDLVISEQENREAEIRVREPFYDVAKEWKEN